MLDENDKLVRNKKEVANIFDDFFVNIVPNLGINAEHNLLNTTNISHNPIELLFISTRIILVSFQLKIYERY